MPTGDGGRKSRPRRRTVPWRGAAALLLGSLSAALAQSPPAPASPEVSVARGEALFEGREPLAGKIRQHLSDLPPAVVACGNCHRPEATTQALPNQAPRLDRNSLLTPASRRNGPASAYDLPTFCRVLHTGVDPRSIMVARAMPVFDLDPAQCESLWTYLTEGSAR